MKQSKGKEHEDESGKGKPLIIKFELESGSSYCPRKEHSRQREPSMGRPQGCNILCVFREQEEGHCDWRVNAKKFNNNNM